jgi:hypothetical protein
MTIAASDIVTLLPTSDDIRAAVSHAIKSGVPYTYDRMEKDAWRRVARIARGKVNEAMIRRFAAGIGIALVEQEKSYRDHDDFDFIFMARRGKVDADVKTFHVLTHFLGSTRKPLNVADLLCGLDYPTPEWHRFFPMLVPFDYKRHKDVYIFGVSVEADSDWKALSVLPYPWSAFPDAPGEASLVNPNKIAARERFGSTLEVSLSWSALSGGGAVVYEVGDDAYQAQFKLDNAGSWSCKGLLSFLAVQLDDDARKRLWKQRASLVLIATESADTIRSTFDAARFYEVFPRQEYVLHLIGWIGRDEFGRKAKHLPKGSSCYFYPPKENPNDRHAPGTKTDNWYVLPGVLNPITTLMEA